MSVAVALPWVEDEHLPIREFGNPAVRQMSLFDWTPPPPARVRPPRRDEAERSMTAALHVRPDPVRVYRQSVSHGYESCRGRWWWMSKSDLGRMIAQGRAITVGERSAKVRRNLSPAQEEEVVAVALELGGVLYAAEATGIPESMVRTLLRERGLDYPRATRTRANIEAARARVAAYRARRAA